MYKPYETNKTLLPNGKCYFCKTRIKKVDKFDSEWRFIAVDILVVSEDKKEFLVMCPTCSNYQKIN